MDGLLWDLRHLVTHSDAIAAHGNRKVILRDGWLYPRT